MTKKLLSDKNKNQKLLLVAKKAFAVFALFLMIPGTVLSQSLNDQIREAEDSLSNVRAEKTSLAAEISRFNNQIATAEQEIYKTNLKINNLNEKIGRTKKEINSAEKELIKLNLQLQEVIRVMYEEGQVSTIEVMAKAGSFSEYVNRSEYLEQINLKVKEASNKAVSLKRKLVADKKQLEISKASVLKEKQKQVAERNSLASTRNTKNQLLAQTKGSESAYKKLLSNLYAKRAALARENGEIIGGGGTGGYQYAGSCWNVDPWKFYTCQCTSYAAWNWNRLQGKSWTNTRPGQGDAYNWPALASDQGYTVSNTPTVGAIVVWPKISGATPYGHVAIVTAVYGSKISVAEYNWAKPLKYGTRDNVSIYFYGRNLKFIR